MRRESIGNAPGIHRESVRSCRRVFARVRFDSRPALRVSVLGRCPHAACPARLASLAAPASVAWAPVPHAACLARLASLAAPASVAWGACPPCGLPCASRFACRARFSGLGRCPHAACPARLASLAAPAFMLWGAAPDPGKAGMPLPCTPASFFLPCAPPLRALSSAGRSACALAPAACAAAVAATSESIASRRRRGPPLACRCPLPRSDRMPAPVPCG